METILVFMDDQMIGNTGKCESLREIDRVDRPKKAFLAQKSEIWSET